MMRTKSKGLMCDQINESRPHFKAKIKVVFVLIVIKILALSSECKLAFVLSTTKIYML